MRRLSPMLTSHVMLGLLVLFLGATPIKAAKDRSLDKSKDIVPLTTRSAIARDHYEKGMVYTENVRTEKAVEEWRKAATADPQLAMAHMMLSYSTSDPVEEERERKKAKTLTARITPGEKLMIAWFSGLEENNFVPAISAMNDLQAQYPRDKRLAYLVGRWLGSQRQYEPAKHALERALALDKDYAAALNEIGYAYAHLDDFDSAIKSMRRYVALLPGEPNPEDSFAEILRLSGNYEDALQHYNAALKIDASFHSSQVGLGDTYALMGEEERARSEYAKALVLAPTEAARLLDALQSAITYVREKHYPEAEKAFEAVTHEAHSHELGGIEAEAHRMMAMFQPEDSVAGKHLDEAEAALAEKHEIAKIDADEEHALILYSRCERQARGTSAGEAVKISDQLELMASSTRSNTIQRAYHGCAGAIALADSKFADAIAQLDEDGSNPFSMQRLSTAYEKSGDLYESERMKKKLAAVRQPTEEQALIVGNAQAAK